MIRRIGWGGAVSTVAGTATQPGFSGDNGYGVNAKLDSPWGLAARPEGDWLFWTEAGNCVLRKLVLSDGAIRTYAGVPGSCGCVDGPAAVARFGSPAGIAMNGSDYVLIADMGCNAIRRFQISTRVVTTIAGMLGNTTGGFADGAALGAARFNAPTSVAYDATSDRLYVAGECQGVVYVE